MSILDQVSAINLTALSYIKTFSDSHHGMSIRDLIDMGVITLSDLGKEELAALTNTDPQSPILNWSLINCSMTSFSGFKGVAFENNGQIVFSFRGTEPAPEYSSIDMLKDIYTDLQLALPDAPLGEPNQFRDAYNFVKSTIEGIIGGPMTAAQLTNYVQTHTIEFVGHSLGGALVQYVIAEIGAGYGTTFNAVGIGQVLDTGTSDYSNMITDYVNADDLVGNFGVQLGTTQYLQGTQDWTSIDQQAIAQFFGIFTSMLDGTLSPFEGIKRLQDAMQAMNSETASYILSGWTSSHNLDTLMSNPNTLSSFTSTNNVSLMIDSYANVADVAANTPTADLLAGAIQVVSGVANATTALSNLEDGIRSSLDEAKLDVSTQVGVIVDNAIVELRDRLGVATDNASIVQTEVGTMVSDINSRIAAVLADKSQELVQSFLLGAEGFNDLFESVDPVKAAVEIAERVMRGESITSAIYSELESSLNQGIDGINDILISINDIADAVNSGVAAVVSTIHDETSDHLARILPAVEDLVGNIADVGAIFSAASVDVLGVLSQELVDFGGDLIGSVTQFASTFDATMGHLSTGLGHLLEAALGSMQNSFLGFIRGDTNVIDSIRLSLGVLIDAFMPIDPNGAVSGTWLDDTLYGYSGANLIEGYGGSDIIYAGGGNDTVLGGGRSDTLYGGAGNDVLYGGDERNWESYFVPEHAADTLDGGVGDDILQGGAGNDTYVFGKGYGHDIINDWAQDVVGSLNGGFDTIKFLAGVGPSDVAVHRRDYNNLEFKIVSTGETITVQNFFGGYYNNNRLEKVTFADGTTWDEATLLEKARYIHGTDTNDVINGYYDQSNIIHAGAGDDMVNGSSGADTLYGHAGSDTLEGGSGADTLDGGTGDDTLRGSDGNDTYIYGRGDGHDTIIDEVPYSGSPWANYNGGTDIIQFSADVTPEDIEVYRIGAYDLEFRLRGTDDTLRIKNHFSWNSNNAIESVIFDIDNTTWSKEDFEAKALTTLGTADGEGLYGTEANNLILGGAGDDQILGYGGNDTLDGGIGTDFLGGGKDNDIYIFGLGYGVDTVFDSDATLGSIDTIRFLPEVDPSSISVTRNGNNVELSIIGTNDKLIIERYFSAYDQSNTHIGSGAHKIERFEFADGTVWTSSHIEDVIRVLNGTEADDVIYGHDDLANVVTSGDGNDTVYGGSLNDEVNAGTGNDTIHAGYGNDTLIGGADNDSLYGDMGNDTLTGETGNDLLEGGAGNDTYRFGIGYGSDTIYDSDTTAGNQDKIQLLEGITPADVRLTRVGENLVLSIADTTDTLTIEKYFSEYARTYGWYATHVGENGNKIETIEFADGTAWSAADIKDKVRYITGTDSNDYLSGYADQKNIISAGEGNDTIYAAPLGDDLHGEGGDDYLYGSNGNDLLLGGTGNDILEGNIGNDTYEFALGFGVDTIYDNDSTTGNVDTISFLGSIAPEDVIVTRSGENLELTVIGNNDKLIIEKYFSEYARTYGWYSYYTGVNSNKIENITFTDGTVWTIATVNDIVRRINGTEADDFLQGLDGQQNIISGGDGDDTIYAGSLGDEMSGGAGNDTLRGSYGSDTLDGGSGSDSLEGGHSNDTYLFNAGSGNDVIYDSSSAEGNTDKIIFGSAITKEDVTLQRDGDNLVFTFAGSMDTLTIERYFSGYARPSGWSQSYVGINGNKIEQIQFADGTVWGNEEVIEKVAHIFGTQDADSLTGIDGQQNKLSGLDGNDTLTSASYGDYLDGGAGDDILNGSYGQDTLKGGTGSDTLLGGGSSDTYVFAAGDGHDTIYDGDTSYAADTISFTEGIEPSDVEMTRSGNDLVLKVNGGTDDSITIQSYFSGVLQGSGYEYGVGVNKIERIIFADGTIWHTASLEDQFRYITGTTSNDTLNGYETDDVITAQEGNDMVHAGIGNDTVDAGEGNDIIYSEAGNDQLIGGAGNDTLNGGIGNDVIDGGTDNDVLVGNEGSDTYIFRLGDGTDEINDSGVNAGEVDVIAFQSGISPQDVTLQRSGDDLVLATTNTADSLTVKGYFSAYREGDPTEYGVGVNKIEQVTFTDGTVWNSRTIEYAVSSNHGVVDPNVTFGTSQSDGLYADQDGQTVYADEGDDSITGQASNDTLYGEAGNDTIHAGQGNDTLVGGAGNDHLHGEEGSDTYLFTPGFGHDTIADYDTTQGNIDTIAFSSEIAPGDITLSRVGNNLILASAAGDSITIQSYFAGAVSGHHKIEQVTFADGTVWDTTFLETATPSTSTYDNTVVGSEYNDYLYGTSGNDAISGGAGSDTVYSDNGVYDGIGNDLLDGGTGNDTLYGAGGDDTYVFGLGYGQDYLLDESRSGTGAYIDGGYDTLKIMPGVAPEDIIVRRSGVDMIIEIAGTSDSITIGAFFREIEGVYTSGIERVQFSDPSQTVWTLEDLVYKAQNIEGTSGNETLYGYEGQDNILKGVAGDDTLYGASGDDTLDGGTGNDTLQGSYGNDTYVFGIGYGVDTIDDSDSTTNNQDTIQFLEGVTPQDVHVIRNGDRLELSIVGTEDRLMVERYFSPYNRNGYYTGSEDGNKIERVQFADGTTWSIADIKDKARHISGTVNDDSLYGYGDQQNIIAAGDGNDAVYAGGWGDQLDGGSGNDSVFGSSGNDILVGGTGNDQLEGNTGNDKYIFTPGFGNDTIYDIDSSEGNIDTVQFLEGISPEDVVATRSGENLVLTIVGTTDSLTIERYFSQYTRNGYYAGSPDAQKVEVIEFADGTTWSINDIKDKVRHMSGTAGDDIISGFGDQQNVIAAGAGNDTIYASYQGDEIFGEEGNDTIFGSSASDTLNGGAGNDTLEGSSGNDSYVYSLGDGNDTIYDTDSTEGNVDNVTFLEGISPADVTVKRAGDNLELSFTGTSDKLTIERYFSAYPRYGYYSVGENGNKIEEFRFADGTVWDIAAIKEKARHIMGTEGDDALSGYGDQRNIIKAGIGNDTIYASYQGDEVSGEAGNDTIYGSSGNDTLDGGTGNDTIEGLTGNDTYTFKLGDGQDVIYDTDQGQGSSIDVVEFGEGINASDVIAKRLQNEDLELTNAVTGDKLIIERYFSGYYKNSSWHTGADSNKIEEFRFADGTVWDIAAVKEKVREINGTDSADSISGFGDQKNTISGKEGDDNLYAASLGDALYGNEGSDNLYGGSGEDTLVGGSGNDRLEGLTGNDTYVFALGDGQDVIYDTDHGQGGTIDAVSFLEGINPADVSIKRLSNDDLEIAIAGTSDKLTIERYFSSYYKNSSWSTGVNSNAIEEFRFADGTIWDIAIIKDKAQYITGTEYSDTLSGFGDQQNTIIGGDGDDYLYAGYQGDSLYGDAGNDTIYGNSGNDHLRSGIGNDRLEGSTGNDTYAFNLGDGQDVIYDTDHGQGGSLDVVQFGDSITASNIKVKRLSNDDLEIQIVGTDDKLTVERYFSDYYRNSSWNTGVDSNTIEEFRFNDGSFLDRYSIEYFLNKVDGTELSDVLHGNEAANTITGFAGDDSIYAAGGHDVLYGDAGNDYLSGGADSDVLMGGAGNDILEGGADDDIYTVNAGGGIDTIYDSHGSHDLLQITLDKNNLIFTHSGNDLKVLVNGASDEIIVGDWNTSGSDTIEEIVAVDWSTITSTQVNQLIQAMAAFSSENNGMSWSQALQDRPNDVQAILAQHWTAPTA